MIHALRRVAMVAAFTSIAGLLAPAPAATASPAPQSPTSSDAVIQSVVTAPTNLRVTAMTSTSVTFRWDHSQGAQPGCTLRLILYTVFVNGAFHGWTIMGSPVGHVAGLRPGTTYELAVQGRDNCTGATSPMSAPLIVTTPTR